MPKYRITYRHEVIIEAETSDKAKDVWESISLGSLDNTLNIKFPSGELVSHEFVERVSFEDEDYNDIN